MNDYYLNDFDFGIGLKELNSDVDAILSLENKTIRDLELRDNVVIGQLCKEVVK